MAKSDQLTSAPGALLQVSPAACKINGELSFFTAAELLQQWQTMFFNSNKEMQPNQTLTIDLADLSKADSAAVAFCVAAVREGKAHQCTVQFINPPASLVAIAKIVRLESLFLQ